MLFQTVPRLILCCFALGRGGVGWGGGSSVHTILPHLPSDSFLLNKNASLSTVFARRPSNVTTGC